MPRALDVVLDALYKDSDSQGVCQLSLAELVESCHLPKTTVRRALQRLEAENMIEVNKRGTGRGNRTVYKVLKRTGRTQRYPRSLGTSNKSLVSVFVIASALCAKGARKVPERCQTLLKGARKVPERCQTVLGIVGGLQRVFGVRKKAKKRPFSSPSFPPLEPPSSTPSSSPEKREKRGPVLETITANRLVTEPNESQNRAFLGQKTKALQSIQSVIGRNKRRMAGLDRAYQHWKAKALDSGLCPVCGLVIDRFDIEEGVHKCVRPYRDRDNNLATERERLEIELWEAERPEEELPPVGDPLRGLSLQTFMGVM